MSLAIGAANISGPRVTDGGNLQNFFVVKEIERILEFFQRASVSIAMFVGTLTPIKRRRRLNA